MGMSDTPDEILSDGGDGICAEYRDEPPVRVIARGISTLEDCPVTDAPRVYDYVDPVAVNQLMETARDRDQDVTLEVTIDDYDVSVKSDGTISIRDSDTETGPSDHE